MYLIRLSTNIKYGMGHLSRCRAIRKKIIGKVIWFLDKNTADHLKFYKRDETYEESNKSSVIKLKNYIKFNKVKGLLIDTPFINEKDINAMSLLVPIVIFVDKYTNKKNVLNICLHPINISERNFISGLKYLPYYKKKKYSSKFDKKKNILVAFGNVDTKNYTFKIIKILKKILEENKTLKEDIKIYVVLGTAYNKVQSLRRFIINQSSFKLFEGLTSLQSLYKKIDFAIGAPGYSQIERLEYNIPSILVAQNKIQKKLLKYWKESGCAIISNNYGNNLKRNIEQFIISNYLINKLGRKIDSIFDDKGAIRLAAEINSFIKKFNKKKKL